MDYVLKKPAELTESEIARWIALQEADPEVASAFFRPEYAIAVEEARGNVELVLLREDGHLVGVLPFERNSRNVGRAVAWRLSDCHGLVSRLGLNWSPAELVRAAGLVAWKFDHLIASQEPFRRYHHWIDDAPYMDLRGGYDVYCAQREAATTWIRQGERKKRKLERNVGPVRFEFSTLDGLALEKLLEWKSRQIAKWELYDVFRVDWVVRLLEALQHARSPGFAGALSALYAGEHLAAVHFGLKSHRHFCAWIPTHNPELAVYSPGLLLHLELAKCAAEGGYERIDLGRGLNDLKRSLASGNIRLAIGAVDTRPAIAMLSRLSQKVLRILPTSRLRNFSPAVAALRFARRIENRFTRS